MSLEIGEIKSKEDAEMIKLSLILSRVGFLNIAMEAFDSWAKSSAQVSPFSISQVTFGRIEKGSTGRSKNGRKRAQISSQEYPWDQFG